MGENLVLNIESKGFPIAVYNRTAERTRKFADNLPKNSYAFATYSIDEFLDSLESPRRILIMVKAGSGVDEVISVLAPKLSKEDVVVDGGNSYYLDTERRTRRLAEDGVLYLGIGISGGAQGARKGPCLMVGGVKEGYALVESILTKIAAQLDDGPCSSYLGPGGAGHLTKIGHNGIEYAVLQIIAEAYDILRNGLGLGIEEVQGVFQGWNAGDLSSYLMGAAAAVLGETDSDTGRPLVDLILDKAGQKGTGKWFSQTAMDLGVPTPTIDASVSARSISAYRDERLKASRLLNVPQRRFTASEENLVEALHDAVYGSIIVSYAQGLALLKSASNTYEYNITLAEVCRIWRGGCIIRARLLDQIRGAYIQDAKLPNLLLDGHFASLLVGLQQGWRDLAVEARSLGIPCPAINASLDYFDSYRRHNLPASVIQGIRDYFGAHGYERVDKPGQFHGDWLKD